MALCLGVFRACSHLVADEPKQYYCSCEDLHAAVVLTNKILRYTDPSRPSQNTRTNIIENWKPTQHMAVIVRLHIDDAPIYPRQKHWQHVPTVVRSRLSGLYIAVNFIVPGSLLRAIDRCYSAWPTYVCAVLNISSGIYLASWMVQKSCQSNSSILLLISWIHLCWPVPDVGWDQGSLGCFILPRKATPMHPC